MNGYAIALLFSAVFAVVVYVPFRFVVIERVRRQTQRYPIFAVRDEFVRLKVMGAFDADPELYDFYINVCNGLIQNTRKVDLRLLLSAVAKLTPESQKKARFWQQKTEKAPPQVGVAVGHLYVCTVHLLRENSTLVRFLASPVGRATCVIFRRSHRDEALEYVGRVSPPTRQAVREYREISNMMGKYTVTA